MIQKKPTDDTLILYAELSPAEIRAVQRRVQSNELRRIMPGLVTSLSEPDWTALIQLHRNRILAALFPGAVIAFRSAFEGGVSHDGELYLNYKYYRTVRLPGLTVMLIKGPKALSGDMPMLGKELYFPSTARILLQNLSHDRNRRSVDQALIEERLINICDARGEEGLNQIRDQAQSISELGFFKIEFKKLDEMIGQILGTRKSPLVSRAAKAWSQGLPYDSVRLALFEKLATYLRKEELPQVPTRLKTEQSKIHFAFLESYFSNFIEGTEFEIDEARAVMLEGRIIAQRPKDSHDIFGVFQQSIHPRWSSEPMMLGSDVLSQLQNRHIHQMEQRPEVMPGVFKEIPNYAGSTAFVMPQYVKGTLIEASYIAKSVPEGLARAIMTMFIIAEVHPFNDGNGRLARLLMNAELSYANQQRIIVPTLFRDEYLDCLRVLTRNQESQPLIRAMQKMQAWTADFDYEDLNRVIDQMRACHAFEKSRVLFKLLSPKDIPGLI